MKDYIIQSDTDSLYIEASDLLRHRYPDIDLDDDNIVVDRLKPIMKGLEDELNAYYKTFCKSRFNSNNNRLKTKSETIARKLYVSAPKQYAQLIVDKEGVTMEGEDRFDFKGLDFMKSSFPVIFRQFTQDLVKDILFDKPKSYVDELILDFRDKFKTLPLDEVSKPVGVNKDFKDYIRMRPKTGFIFSQFAPKTPAHIKACIYYNDLLRFKGLDKKHSVLQIGDKLKWMYLKDNPYKIKTLAYSRVDPPKEIMDFIETYMDREKMFNSMLVNKLQTIYDNLVWGEINFNKNTKKFFRFNN